MDDSQPQIGHADNGGWSSKSWPTRWCGSTRSSSVAVRPRRGPTTRLDLGTGHICRIRQIGPVRLPCGSV